MTDRDLPRHRGLFWAAILAALAALVGGSLFAYVTYAATAGPDGAVKGYFAALARSDAAAALGFGELPPGQHQLLTSTVLRAQQHIAPIRDVQIVATDESGDTATVAVRYHLAFADASQQAVDDIKVLRHKGSWRLAQTATSTQLNLREAGDRASIVGGSVPDGEVLIFPGAVPITFDTPNLTLAAATSSVTLSAQAQTDLTVQVSAIGARAVDTALAVALRACLAGGPHADPRCPLPSSRAVPGSLRAAATAAAVRRAAHVSLASSAAGVLTVSGTIRLLGRYTALDFNNLPLAKRGRVTLSLRATAYVTDPVTINWAPGQ
jgi:hypothetical protein